MATIASRLCANNTFILHVFCLCGLLIDDQGTTQTSNGRSARMNADERPNIIDQLPCETGVTI
jgi:hypothetical protein